MNSFIYRDYIKCIHTLRLNAVFKLAEESERYDFKDKEEKNEQRIKEVLVNDKEMTKLINNFLDLKEKIKYGSLERFDGRYIMKKYKMHQEKLIYKLKYKETYFLVEEVSKLDNIVLYEILNYCISIMQEWNLKNKIKQESNYPIIIPIIIYMGSEKLNVRNIENNKNMGDYIFKNYKINLKYNLIDINKIPINVLMKINTNFSNIMLMQKFKNKKDRIS